MLNSHISGTDSDSCAERLSLPHVLFLVSGRSQSPSMTQAQHFTDCIICSFAFWTVVRNKQQVSAVYSINKYIWITFSFVTNSKYFHFQYNGKLVFTNKYGGNRAFEGLEENIKIVTRYLLAVWWPIWEQKLKMERLYPIQ